MAGEGILGYRKMNKARSKSPLKERPLRLPGQSLDEQINNILNEKLLSYGLFAFGFFLLAAVAWIQLFTRSQINPWTFSGIAVLAIGYCGFGLWHTRKYLNRLRLGRDGERKVGEELDKLKRQGAIVFHDLIADDFNIDHVVLSRNGIFVLETKTRSKPARGSANVTFDGESLLINGFKPDRNPITQVQSNARWLSEMLRDSTGREFPVRPVVLFPGWFVENLRKGCSVWVLNPQALPSFIQHEPTRINENDLHLATFHLGRYIRSR